MTHAMHDQDSDDESTEIELARLLNDSDEEAIRFIDEARASSSAAEESQKGPRSPAELFAWRPLVAILFISLVQPICIQLIFPFVSTSTRGCSHFWTVN